jgi:PAS domain S-box-containing protein
VLLAKDYHVPFANKFFRERFGESHGRCCFDYLFQRSEPCEDCESYKALKTGAPHHWEWTGPDGRNYDIYDFPFTDSDGSLMIMEMGIDITEVKQAQAALRKNQELLNDAQRVSRLGGWECDVGSGRVVWTDEVYRIHGVTKDYDPTHPQQDIQFYAPEDQSRIADAFRRATEDGEPYDLELQLVTAQGNRIWVRTMGQVERKDGKIVRVFGNIMDITERKQAQAALQELNATLEQRVAERTKELAASNEELAAFNSVAVGRELRMIELKKQVNDLCARAGLPARYDVEFAEKEGH